MVDTAGPQNEAFSKNSGHDHCGKVSTDPGDSYETGVVLREAELPINLTHYSSQIQWGNFQLNSS